MAQTTSNSQGSDSDTSIGVAIADLFLEVSDSGDDSVVGDSENDFEEQEEAEFDFEEQEEEVDPTTATLLSIRGRIRDLAHTYKELASPRYNELKSELKLDSVTRLKGFDTLDCDSFMRNVDTVMKENRFLLSFDFQMMTILELDVERIIAGLKAEMAKLQFDYAIIDPGDIHPLMFHSSVPQVRRSTILGRHDYWLQVLNDAAYPWGGIQ